MAVTTAQRRARNDVLAIGLDSRTSDLCDLVFRTDSLRETIIDYVVHDNKGGLSKQDAFSCRLVQKSWLDSVFKCLTLSGTPLIEFGISRLWKRKRQLEPFLEIYRPSSPFPFKLTAALKSTSSEWDLQLLENCLNLCGNGLVELKLELELVWSSALPEKNKTYLRDFTQQSFTLPVLQKLTCFVLHPCNTGNGDIHINVLPQGILSGCLRLKQFELIGAPSETKLVSSSIGILIMPETITKLVLDCKITNRLELLMTKNHVPKLTDLTLAVPDVLDGEDKWMSEVLNRFRFTLKRLHINGERYARREMLMMTKADPPEMKCLESIAIRTKNFDWVDGIRDLHQKFPVLRKIDLQHLTSTSLDKWTENSKFASLTDVSIMFINTPTFEKEFFTWNHARRMPEAFPKVTKLEISTCFPGNVFQALQCLFQNMTQLQFLTIKLIEIGPNVGVIHPQYLDALLLGIPCELIATLKRKCERRKLWEAVQLRMDKQLSVSNLSQLRELRLACVPFDQWNGPLFVSDRVEKFVVSTMPNLQKINLPHPDKCSQTGLMEAKWKLTGRIFTWA